MQLPSCIILHNLSSKSWLADSSHGPDGGTLGTLHTDGAATPWLAWGTPMEEKVVISPCCGNAAANPVLGPLAAVLKLP